MSQHSLCESPHCPFCRTETPILCDEIKIDNKFIIRPHKEKEILPRLLFSFMTNARMTLWTK